MIKQCLRCMFSPQVYKCYKDRPGHSTYQPYSLERLGDNILSPMHTFWNMSMYTSPLILLFLYKTDSLNYEGMKHMSKYLGVVGCLFVAAIVMRGVGRAYNNSYMEFLRVYDNEIGADREAYLRSLRRYDFDFKAWPVSYQVSRQRGTAYLNPAGTTESPTGVMTQTVWRPLAYLALHTFALKLVYPGSLGLLHFLFGSALMDGRTELVERYGGLRSKVRTADGNCIDTMFVDNRGSRHAHGSILVICCEGNTGFYEVGLMTVPLRSGYSTLGWNHPGFACSTGSPYLSQVQNAMDAVMQYAIMHLGFNPEQIVLYGWSIGGYPATLAAVNYPDIKGLVLDATFDDLLPLAVKQMPSSWEPIVVELVRSYLDLNVAKLLTKYCGPVIIIRRMQDEILSLTPGDFRTNRANNLMLSLLMARHPELIEPARRQTEELLKMDASQRQMHLRSAQEPQIIEITKLVDRYLRDWPSTHCTPFDEAEFASLVRRFQQPNYLPFTPDN